MWFNNVSNVLRTVWSYENNEILPIYLSNFIPLRKLFIYHADRS